ncbi:PKD domain-containing protein [Nitratireductor mangrovi]|uniref:PKD domain-containing protein n=1 Tax=Nitratireductor mangrovi TaxID=2599600 RepID=A0A5B8KZI0_9HYPH|nr:PKD domain-containing protein [Nitratireductor mangrovi]QDZ01167.2 PKD domain-containing protein [Nitratireductor mangrovi]
MTAPLARALFATPLRRNAALFVAGMLSALAPIIMVVHGDAIRRHLPSIVALAKNGLLDPAHPYLVTFGSDAVRQEGDHDFSQLLRFSVPADAGRVYVRVFDADTGGAHDEMQGSAGTSVRFSLYGDGAQTRLWRDDDGVVQETVSGEALGAMEFGADKEADDRWLTLFAADAESGSEEAGNRRGFIVAVEGLAGNDGNVFDIAVSSEDGSNRAPDGLSLYTYMPTFQVPRGREMAELRLELPEGASSLAVENFDAAGGRLAFAGRFRSQAIAASGKSEWKRETITLEPGEAGGIASLTAANGSEIPNDLTLFAGIADNGADPAGQPVAITLPIRAFPPNRRPETALSIAPLACRQTGFDASGSTDPDGGDLTFRWRLGADGDWLEGATVTADFDSDGVKQGRLEVFDASGLVGNGRASEFSFFVKPKPVAALEAPALVAEGAAFTLDATGSTSPALPEGNRISHYRFDMGDGTVIEQAAGEAGFGMPSHTYRKHGTYTVTLTVTDAAGHPCNTDTKTAQINVNAPPVANAGPDLKVATGEKIVFDAGPETGVDGDNHRFTWDFGNGKGADTPKAEHSYDDPGTYTVRLKADDGRGIENSVAEDMARVFVNAPPLADGVTTPGRLVAGMPGDFDASAALDPDGRITAYAWSFGDGTSGDKAQLRHSFAEAGTYEVTLAVTDDSGLSNGTTEIRRTVTVVETGNEPPVAEGGGEREVLVGEVAAFDASGSRDPDGSLLSFRWDFGDGTTAAGIQVDHVYRTAGTYRATLTVMDDSGRENASASTSFDVVVSDPANASPVVHVGGDRAAFVNEVLDFDAVGTFDGDGNIVSVEWSFGDGARASGFRARHSYKKPGEYRVSVLVRDDSGRRGAVSEASFTVTVTHPYNEAPVIDLHSELTMETGIAAVFDASGAIDPDGQVTRYRWDFGDGTSAEVPVIAHSYATPGTYFGKLTLVDDSGLENGVSENRFVVFVEERRNTAPVAVAGPDRTAKVGERIDFDGGASSDTDGNLIAYHWDFGNGKSAIGQRRSIVYFEPGSYEVTLTVTDSSGQNNASAIDTLIVTVGDRPNSVPVAAVEDDRPAAIGEPVRFSGGGSSDPNGNILSYEWDFGDGERASGREVVHAYAKSGTYRAQLTIRDDSGLADGLSSAIRTITVNEPPIADAGPDQHVTASAVTFDASRSVDPDGRIASYLWDFGDGSSAAGERVTHVYGNPGTYRVKLVVEDASGTIRNTAEDEMSVRVNALPVADAGFDIVAAPGETITFDGRRSSDPDGKIATWSWDFRDGTQAEGDIVEHAFAAPGLYTVELTVRDDSGHDNATDFSQILVTVNAPPVADAGPDISVAPGQSFTLSASRSMDKDGDIADWRWDVQASDDILIGEQVDYSFADPGIYTISLTVTDDSGAANSTASDEVIVEVNHAPVAEAGRDIFSEALRVVLDASASADADNDGLSYLWDLGDGNIAEGAQVEHTYLTGGIYPVVLTVNDGRGLANSTGRDALTVRINRRPTAAAGDNRRACVGDVLVFDGSSSVDPDNGLLRYKWDFGDGDAAEIVNPTKTFETPGTYRVKLEVADESGLANDRHTDELLATVLPAPVADAGEDMKVCANTTVRFDGTKSTDIDGVVNRFSWDFGDGRTGGGDRPEHVFEQAGTYRVTLQIEGDNLGFCSPLADDEITVTVQSAPRAVIQAPRAVAAGEEVVFDGTTSYVEDARIGGYFWDFGDGETGQGAVARHVFERPGTYHVQLRADTAAEQGGCASAATTHVLTVNSAPIADAGGDRTVEVNQPLVLSGAGSQDSDGGIAAYEWDFGDGNSASGVDVLHIWRQPGRYRVALTVSDGTGLSNESSTTAIWVDVADVPKTAITSPDVACAGEAVDFGLANLPQSVDPATIAWSFGDGETAAGAATRHAYRRAGTYSVGVSGTLERAGQTVMTPLAKRIVVNRPPVAIAEAERKACPGHELGFDATKSFDADGAIDSYRWDFGDGDTAEGASVAHRFSQPGTYRVRLTATDNSGSACAAGVQEFDVFVNAAPVADAGPDVDIFIGGAHDNLVLDAGRSTDADGDALSHYWSLSNGFEFDGEKARVEFDQPGTYIATLTTNDNHGLACSETTDQLTIEAGPRSQSSSMLAD